MGIASSEISNFVALGSSDPRLGWSQITQSLSTMAQLRLPVWAVIWVVVSTIIVFADAA